jgi:Kef-type K+ transport system membrane component KefB
MSPFLQLIFALAIILIAAKSAGYLAIRLGQPSVLGELLVGLLLGPTVLNMLQWPVFTDHTLAEMINHLAEIGVLLLMFVAGLELHLNELVHNRKVSAYAGILGVLLPVGLGYLVGVAFGYPAQEALFMGLALGATSVSISAQTLMELKVLRSRVGLGLLGAAVFDDVLDILLLSGFLAIIAGKGSLATVGLLFIRMVIFLALSLLFGMKVLPYIVRRVAHLPISQSILALALVVMIVFGLAAELVGNMAAITGTFIAGLMFARSPEKERLERGINALAYGFFVPIFFVNIGLGVNVREITVAVFWLFVAITVAAILGKLIGAGLGARLASFSWRESLQLGAGMISRGEVGLIIAAVGLEEGILSGNELSAIVGMILVTTLITPPLLRALFSPRPARKLAVESAILDEERS